MWEVITKLFVNEQNCSVLIQLKFTSTQVLVIQFVNFLQDLLVLP